MSRRLFLIIAGLAVGLIVVTLVQRNRPERVIERRIERIEALVGKNGSENNLTTVGKMKNLMEMFHDPFEFRADPFNFSTRDPRSLAGAVQRYREGSERVTMRTSDREIEVDAASGRATSLVNLLRGALRLRARRLPLSYRLGRSRW